MKDSVFWDIRTQFEPNRRHITFQLQSSAFYYYVTFEVFTAVTMKNALFWDVTSCGSCKNRRFGGAQHFHDQGEKNRRARKTVSSN
jgi:hypothetical protein